MIKKFGEYINEGVKDLMTGKPVDEVKESIEQLLDEAYDKGHVYTHISFFDDDTEDLLNDYFLMKDIHNDDVFYIKYKDSVMTVMEVKGGEYWSVIYRDKTITEFKEMLETTLKKL